MQLPPTILSLDDKKKKKAKEAPRPTAKPSASNSKKAATKKDPVASVEIPKDPPESDSDLPEDSNSEDTLPKAAANLSLNPTTHRTKLVPPRTLETTLFDRLEAMYGASIKRMLEVQYRFVMLNLPALTRRLNSDTYTQYARTNLLFPLKNPLRLQTQITRIRRFSSPARPSKHPG